MSPHETRPDSPVEMLEAPGAPCWHWRGTLRFRSQLKMRTSAPAATAEESLEAPSNSHGDWTFRRPHKLVLEVHVVTREEPQVSYHNSRQTRRFSPQREMRTFSREIPTSLLSLERVLDSLEATQEVPQYTSLLSRGTPRVSPQLKNSPGFPSSSREEDPFPCFVGKGIPGFLSHLKRRWSQLDTREELQGSRHHFKRFQYHIALQIHLTPLH